MSEAEDSPLTPDQRRKRKRRILWGVGLVLLGLTLVLAPPLINANRLSHRIAASMSQSLGRPVHLDQVALHVLPTPGFTLSNLVVSEDPAFGFEPVIRAQTVEASIRVSSLWRRHVEFGTIHFEDPSVNLVRRADGRWNLESILLHAAHEDAAPTAQKRAGPTPRFPYIEATGARLNVKMGDEKLPFALTEADFALWLPSSQQWHLRLEAKPARTDTNVSDTGLLRIEGTLERAARLPDVPIELTAVWRRAPLGEASHIFSGSDMGWRGDVEATASARGTLGNALLRTTLKLGNVRRSDFIPANMLNLTVECTGRLAVTTAVVTGPACTLPVGEENADAAPRSVIAATADTFDLTSRRAAGLRIGMSNIPNNWLLDWARLFSQRIPETTNLPGSASGTIADIGDAPPTAPMHLGGEFHTLPAPGAADSPRAKTPPAPDSPKLQATLGENRTLTLFPFNAAPADAPQLILSGTATAQSYTLQIAGAATRDELTSLRALLPPLGDGIDELLPTPTSTPTGTTSTGSAPTAPLKVDMLCTRAWGGPQTCVAMRPPEAPRKPHKR